MQLNLIVAPVLQQLAQTLQSLTIEEYTAKCAVLNNSTIGGHTRHVIELYQCLLNGYTSGTVNYEKRKRDFVIETNNEIAFEWLNTISKEINKVNKQLQLEGCFSAITEENHSITTNYYREVIYNLEHTIHHMALIRVGINAVSNLALPKDFGVASSTIKYNEACVQ
jgi:hypothetical protein